MAETSDSIDKVVASLIPSLSRSLAEQFNVFRVMHHGTHEKQLSNVFAWLLRPDATHELGDTFQRIFVKQVANQRLDGAPLPLSGYAIQQEVNTSSHDDQGKDIADIVLSGPSATIVIENFESSDGHGHDFRNYLNYGEASGTQGVVVLLCARREPHRQSNGWGQAVTITYAELLEPLSAHIKNDAAWKRSHPQQHFFINELIEHFVEGPRAVNIEDRIAFIDAMCTTGESARYGHRPQAVAAEEFANLVAQHAKHQFEEGRRTLGQIKHALKRYIEGIVVPQVNEILPWENVPKVKTHWVGQWQWSVILERVHVLPTLFFQFGPSAVAQNAASGWSVANPDYTKVFVGTDAKDKVGLTQTDVTLHEVLDGLSDTDTRLCDSILELVRDQGAAASQ